MTRDGVYRCATGTSKTLPDSRGLDPGIHAVPLPRLLGPGARCRHVVVQRLRPDRVDARVKPWHDGISAITNRTACERARILDGFTFA